MAREVKPENSLAALYPAVAVTWHRERNGDRTPDNTSSKMSYRAWWRCRAGHEWDEIVATRTAMAGWKNGDVAACRVCTGHHVIVAFDCGHTAEVPWQFAEPERGCPPCRKARSAARQAEYEQRRAEGSAAAKQAYADAKKEAVERVAALGIRRRPLRWCSSGAMPPCTLCVPRSWTSGHSVVPAASRKRKPCSARQVHDLCPPLSRSSTPSSRAAR